jgi:hypothetical protein
MLWCTVGSTILSRTLTYCTVLCSTVLGCRHTSNLMPAV